MGSEGGMYKGTVPLSAWYFSIDKLFEKPTYMRETAPPRPINGKWTFHLEQCIHNFFFKILS
jgi:hypothetical protein